ncbi:hypothetical protein GCM10009633_31370 [Janibacter melonis]|uniref:helix-turn-helix transcriptional regulator n=1 Tax=Janibacter melonis TaxID=262209 RepID=UPI001E37737F|nr:response regulator transcription factor [Janibacter melonis]MCB5991658.1 response regulator transcription factor [Janibacter melonis]
MHEAGPSGPIRLSVLNDYEVVVHGVAAMLAPFADEIRVVELDCDMPLSQPVDIALYDAFAAPSNAPRKLDTIVSDDKVGHTVLYTWAAGPEVIAAARDRGLSGVLSKSMSAQELVSALRRICAGETLLTPQAATDVEPRAAGWPGQEQGLTPRQSEVIALVTEGLSNQEIAKQCYLSINSVKSYIRAAYRTMGVSSRSQAVLWGIDHGFHRNQLRLIARDGDGARTSFVVDDGQTSG